MASEELLRSLFSSVGLQIRSLKVGSIVRTSSHSFHGQSLTASRLTHSGEAADLFAEHARQAAELVAACLWVFGAAVIL